MSLIAYHWITLYIEIVLKWVKKSVRGIMNAHVEKTWIFSERNSVPWVGSDSTVLHSCPMKYLPSTKKFVLSTKVGEIVKHKFDDVVTGELLTSDGILWFDMSSFFHELSWESVKNQSPSLYEIVLVYFLSKDMVFAKDAMKGFNLQVLTAEGKEISVSVSSNDGMANFSGWDKFEQVTEVVNDEVESEQEESDVA